MADGLLEETAPDGLLLVRSLVGHAWTRQYQQRGIQIVLAPIHADRQRLPAAFRRPVATLPNRIETTIGEITERHALVHHRAKTFWGLLTETAGTLLAHTFIRLSWA